MRASEKKRWRGLERVAWVVVLERSLEEGVSWWVVGMGVGMDAYVHLGGDVADMLGEGEVGMLTDGEGGWSREGGVVL